jgi:hypothetical protein
LGEKEFSEKLGGDHIAPSLFHRQVCAQRIVAQRANLLVASPVQENTLAPSGPPTARYGVDAARMCPADCGPAGQYIGSKPRPRKYVGPVGAADRALWACAARMCRRDCGPEGQYIGSKPRPRKTRWPWRGRRPRVNNVCTDALLPICRPAGALETLARRCFATDMSPRWGFGDAGAAMFCYQYVAPLGLVRPEWAERIVAQRASILVASPRPRKTRWPCRGRRPRVTGWCGTYVPKGLWPSGPVYW